MKTSNILINILFIVILKSLLIAEQKVTLQLSWLNQFQFAGYYMAKEKGYYKSVGLDVELKEYGKDIVSVREIRDKKVDFAIGTSSLLIDRANGDDVVALGAIFQESPMMLLVTKESGIENISDFKNKRVMITNDARSSASLIAMLSSNNIDLEDIQILEHSFNADDLINNKTDAMASYVSNEPHYLEDKKIDYKMFHPRNYGFDFYGDILFTSREYITKNPKLVEEFFDASMEGWQYAFEHIDESVQIIYEKYNTQNKSIVDLRKEAIELKKLAYDHTDDMIGCLDKDKLDKIMGVYKILGLLNHDVDLDEFIYEHNHHATYAFELNGLEIIYLSITTLVILLLLVLFFVLSSMKAKWLLTRSQLLEEIEKAKDEVEIQKEKLIYQRNILNDIIDNSKDIIALKDENLNYLKCNEYFASLFGESKENIVGKNDFYLFDEDIANYYRDEDRKVLESMKAVVHEPAWVKFSAMSQRQLFRAYSKPFEYEKGKIGLLVYSTDITELKLLEEKNLKNQKLLQQQSKIISIEKLLRNISHQWRQPLTSISIGLSNIKASYEIDGKLDEKEVISEVDNSIKQTEYLSEIINSFSSYLINDDKKSTDIDIVEVFDSLDTVLFQKLLDNNIETIKDIKSIIIYTNRNLLVQSLINIHKNSIEAFITQKVPNEDRYIFLSTSQEDNSLVIIIKDSANGISDETLEQIFEPYFTTKEEGLGVGLSLYITHHIIVDIFNGSISASNVSYEYDNKKIKGTEFRIVLPLK